MSSLIKDIEFIVPPPSSDCCPAVLSKKIPIEQDLMLAIWLNKQSKDFLSAKYLYVVFHQNREVPYLIIPSCAYGLNNQIDSDLNIIPLKNSWANENNEFIFYDKKTEPQSTMIIYATLTEEKLDLPGLDTKSLLFLEQESLDLILKSRHLAKQEFTFVLKDELKIEFKDGTR